MINAAKKILSLLQTADLHWKPINLHVENAFSVFYCCRMTRSFVLNDGVRRQLHGSD